MPPTNAFDSLRIPKIQGRRALLVINCQKDAFNPQFGTNMPNPPDFLDRIRKIVPYYRKTGTDIVWVQTEAPSKQTDSGSESPTYDLSAYMPTRQQQEERPNMTDTDKAKNETAQMDLWRHQTDNDAPVFKKTKDGAELVDELADLVVPETDIMITKNYFSAFDETPLLMGLRMKMITDVHLCGGLTHVSVIYSAVDAAQHGFEVSVVEDCLGYRAENLHLDAMKKMADELGVHGVDSGEIIIESGGDAPPDTDSDLFSGPGFSGINISLANSASAGNITSTSPDPPSTKKYERASRPADTFVARGVRDRSKIGEGDCKVISNALSSPLIASAFETLKTEVRWQAMKHRTGSVPRRVAVQGGIKDDDSVPVYRHPADECPPLTAFSPTVLAIRDEVSALLKQPFNHVLIQLYRSGQDNISEHSDKTLDIVRGSNIVNVSLGAQRKMTLRTKKSGQTKEQQVRGDPREGQKVTLPHNSVFVLGPKTNMRWLHGVRPDKRLETERSEAEKAFGGERISLTFRNIGTWTDKDRKMIWGQGAKKKTREEVEQTVKQDSNVEAPDSEEAERMLTAFGRENHQVDFDWDKEYGEGFNALDLIVVNGPAG